MNFKNNPLLRNILVFFSGNIVALAATIGVQFFLPKLLSIEEYGLYKSFALYLSYTSLFHFGLKDGIYIALCQAIDFDKHKNYIYFSILVLQQLILFSLMFIASFFFEFPIKIILICLSLASFFFIINTYYDALFQSKKKFKTVSVLKVLKELSFFVLLILVYVFFESPNIKLILSAFLISIILTFFVYTHVSKKWIGLKVISKTDFIQIIRPVYKRGFRLIAGNFGHQINTNADKLFVSLFYSIELFAYYSFGGMFFVLTNTFVNSIGTVLLPFLFKEYKHNLVYKHNQLMKLTTSFSVVLFIYLIGVFYFVKYFYSDYVSSIQIIALFYIGMVYNFKINIIQNNFLKTLGLDKQYIRNNYITLCVFVFIMLLLYVLKTDIIFFAFCTSLIMYLRSKFNLKAINSKLNEKKTYWLDDILIFTLGILGFVYAKYFI
ncbi:lipopolysaccharide biosynthesis protein [Aestuariivivens sediminis]|uniref:lipopolysaccharide biosynthesis protein n=1 Tax=Aestuariivivens sediminis TaxID=2913557 RepID=UPI001F58E67E|nr:oligosaccharide flippase family protein [Aestuariivivens sediminis]